MAKREISGKYLNLTKEKLPGLPHCAVLLVPSGPADRLGAGDKQHDALSSQLRRHRPSRSRSPSPEGAVIVMPRRMEKQGHRTPGSRRTKGRLPVP